MAYGYEIVQPSILPVLSSVIEREHFTVEFQN